MLTLGRCLFLVPHRDDEALGCGGLLTSSWCDTKHLLYFNTVHPDVDTKIYDAEHARVIDYLQCDFSVSKHTGVNRLHLIPLTEHISEIETALNTIEPDTLFVPFPDYNQDHRHIYEAAITAARPHDINFFVKNVLLYEQPCSVQTARVNAMFVPQVFVPINVTKKIELYQLYTSQQRGHRTPAMLEHLAAVRGMQSDTEYAEAFMASRMVIK